MNNILRIRLILIFLMVFQTSEAQLLTIKDAVNKAFDSNSQINQLRSQLKQKKEEWRLQTGISSPEISFMKEGIRNNTDPFQERRLTISQSIDFPLTTSYRLKAIKEEVKAAEFKIQAEEQQVKVGVKSRYTEVIYSLHLQKLRDQQLKLATELYNAVYARFETGLGNGIDLINAELQVAEANNGIDDARKQLHLARYSLFNLMGMDPENQKYTIEFADTLKTIDVDISQIQTLALLADQPAYKSSEKEFSASNYFLKEARSNILPDIKLNLYKQDYGDGYNFKGFEVGLSIPIWYKFEQKGRIKTTLARQDEIRWKQQEIRLEMKKEIEHAWHSYEVSRAKMKRYDQTIRSKAVILQELTLKAYRLGEIDLMTLINAQQIYLTSQEHYLSALRDFYIQLVELEKFLNEDLVF